MKFNRCNFLNIYIYIYIFPSRIKDQHLFIKHQRKPPLSLLSCLQFHTSNLRAFCFCRRVREPATISWEARRELYARIPYSRADWWNTPSTRGVSHRSRHSIFPFLSTTTTFSATRDGDSLNRHASNTRLDGRAGK